MSNPLVKMREMQAAMRELEKAMQELQTDPTLKHELEFENELQALLAKFDKTIHEAVQVVDPSFRITSDAATKRVYQKRPTHDDQGNPIKKQKKRADENTVYYMWTNPHSGQRVKAGNILNKEIQTWVQKYGKDEVLGWRELVPAA